MVIETIKLSKLKPAKYNPRYIDDKSLKGLAASIEEFGCLEPIIWNKQTGNIVGGHQRYKVLMSQKVKETDVVVVDLSPEREKALNVTLNNRHIQGDFTAGLELILNEIKTDLPDLYDCLSLDDLLMDIPEIPEPEKGGNTDPNKVPEVAEEPVIKTGDLVTLGKHRILCGDSTKKEDVKRVMGGEKVDMVFTDPPYGMHYDPKMCDTIRPEGEWCNKPKNYKPVMGDEKDYDPTFLMKQFNYCKEQFWFGADYYAERISKKNNGSWIVWDKRAGIEEVQWTTSEFELCWSKQKHHRKIARIKWHGLLGMEKDDTKSRLHPTQKPTLLIIWFLEKWSKENDKVVDFYLGAGSTLIACETTNRICRGIEIDPGYCQVSAQRWIDFTGKPEDVTVERGGKQIPWEKLI